MKKIIFIIICHLLAVTTIKAEQPSSTSDSQLRDSVFRVSASMTQDTLRVKFMRKIFQQNIGKEWAKEILDSALVWSARSEYTRGELGVYFDYYRHYKHLVDTAQMSKSFKQLEFFSKKYKDYDLYFITWGDMLQFNIVRGDTEYAILEAKRMEETAHKLNNTKGILYSRLAVARALRGAKQEEEAIAKFREILEMPDFPDIDRPMIYSEIAGIYMWHNNSEKAIAELEKGREVALRNGTRKLQQEESHRGIMLNLELSFCEIYLSVPDAENLQKHLKEVQKYYTPDCLFSFYIRYHTVWAGYYSLVHEWDACFREYDIALDHFKGTQPLHEMSIRLMKAQAFQDAGWHKEAAETYSRAALEMDSLNRDILQRHEEVHRANYAIRQALLDKTMAERHYNQIWVALVVILVVALAIWLVRGLYVQRTLRRSERETREALETVEAANKMKEVFLRNITYEIRVPLNAVVGFSELLSEDSGLSAGQMQEYAVLVKKNADHLSQLIFDVLDLSRLESGMMKFNVQECDAVQFCRDAKMMVEMRENNTVHIEFHTALENLPIQADSTRFMKLLVSVLSAPIDYEDQASISFSLTSEADKLVITVQGSPLLEVVDDKEQHRIQHDINRLYLKTFGGNYILNKEERKIIIIYPIGAH